MMDTELYHGKVFQSPSGEYGPLRPIQGPLPVELRADEALAEDDCGNYFVLRRGGVGFWDHETAGVTLLAGSVEEFVGALVEPEPVKLHESQVISVWIDPEFARLHGLDREDTNPDAA